VTAPADLEGDVSDLLAMFARKFPRWTVVRTDAGWWAVRGPLLRETLTPDGKSVLRASTPAELYVRLEAVA
jgi:hypothetical protein